MEDRAFNNVWLLPELWRALISGVCFAENQSSNRRYDYSGLLQALLLLDQMREDDDIIEIRLLKPDEIGLNGEDLGLNTEAVTEVLREKRVINVRQLRQLRRRAG